MPPRPWNPDVNSSFQPGETSPIRSGCECWETPEQACCAWLQFSALVLRGDLGLMCCPQPKYKMLERRGGEGNRGVEAQHNSRTTVPLRIQYTMLYVTGIVDLMGAEDIADCIIRWILLEFRVHLEGSNFQILSKQICVAVLVELGQYVGNKEVCCVGGAGLSLSAGIPVDWSYWSFS